MKFSLLIAIAFFTLHCTPGASASRPPVKVDECSKSSSKRIIVFKDDEAKQCAKNSGISPKKQAQELEQAGIKVFKYVKTRSNGMFPAACGFGTGSLNAFYISPEKKSEALALGFKACP